MLRIFIATDGRVDLIGLKDESEQPIIGATVEATLLDADFGEVDQGQFPRAWEDAGDGRYTAHVPHDHGLSRGKPYKVKLVARKGGIRRTVFDNVQVVRDDRGA